MSRKEAVSLLISIGIFDLSKLPNKAKVNGKEIFSVLLPDDFRYQGKSRSKDENGDDEVLIEDGKLIKGTMDKSNLGIGAGLMLRSIHKRYGADFAMNAIEKIFKLGIEVLLKQGFTTSISDIDLPEKANEIINQELDTAEEEVKQLIEEFNHGQLETLPGRSIEETLELKILELLNKKRNKTGQVALDYANKKTNLIAMIDGGGKGNTLNLAQMSACVGQQAMRGKRIEKGYYKRTLSCFKKGDLMPNARGFIKHGFRNGMKPYEFFFGSMTGRDSLMDTALRTPKSGYLYRRLANAMQDLKVEYDDTVRDSAKRIIQFDYGEDGIDVSKSENGTIDVKRIINQFK